ncbi:MAG: EAL domain-containing protein [Neptuniibacter sp.]
MIVAVEPREFDRLLAQYQSEYQAIISYSVLAETPQQNANADLKSSIQLHGDYSLVFNPNSQFMANSLLELKLRLIFIFIVCSGLTYLLLQILIKRYITGPIANLDYQLTAVMEQRQEEISYPHDDDEIGRLGKRFKNLYSQLKRSLDETYTYSRTDSLTQLPNRNSFYETATKKLADAEKHQCRLALLYLDLDNFKFVNDKYGHEIGDQLLKAVAAKMNHTVQLLSEKCTTCRFQVFRLSGDEFTLLMEYVDANSIRSFGKKVLHSFDNGFSFELGHFPVTASLGIATYPEDGHTLSQLISNADLAMYQAKKAGKNQMSFYSKDLAKKDRYKKDIESRLKDIDFDKEFFLNYMPILDRNGNIKGCEALVRWNSKDLGPVSPALFIPIAETTGLFEKVDLWVISQAFKDVPKLKEILGKKMEISINISSAEINSDRFIKKLSHLESRFNLNTANIVFEITETYMPEHQKNALVWLDQLRESGYKIAIDDFGTGYTSLMQMVEYPIDIIKFDKQLVERIAVEGKTDLAKALVDLCHLQGVKVVAEGVETLEQFNILKQINCDYQQGFYISKPMPLEELASWAKKTQGVLKISAIG